MLATQHEGLYACPTPCEVSGDRGDADVLVRMFEPAPRSGMGEMQKAAVINTEAHSLSRQTLEATDLLVGFHRKADVVVGCLPNPFSLFSLPHSFPWLSSPSFLSSFLSFLFFVSSP